MFIRALVIMNCFLFLVEPLAKATNVQIIYNAETQAIANSLEPILKPYNFFDSNPDLNEANCFGTLQAAQKFLAATNPNYKFEFANTPINWKGVYSITHPTLLIHDTSTHETLAVITYTETRNGKLYNETAVSSLGIDPNERDQASALMELNHTQVVKMNDSLYVTQAAASLWDEPKPTAPCIRADGSFEAVTLPNKSHSEIVVSNDGRFFLVKSVEEQKKIEGIVGSVKSVAMLAPANAGVAAGVDSVLGKVPSSALKDAGDMAVILLGGNAVTRLEVSKTVGGLEVGAKTYVTLHPNLDKLAQGSTTIDGYARYTKDGQTFYVDSQGTAYAELTHSSPLGQAHFTLGYTPKDRDPSWNLGVVRQYRRGTLNASIGQGSPAENVNLPSILARPTTNTLDGRSFYFNVGGSLGLRKPASAQPSVYGDLSIKDPNGKDVIVRYKQAVSPDGMAIEYLTAGPNGSPPLHFNSLDDLNHYYKNQINPDSGVSSSSQ